MQAGMVGLGRMGSNMVRRLMRGGHSCVVYDVKTEAVSALAGEGASGAPSLAAFAASLAPPRIVWMMVPAAAVDATIDQLAPHLGRGDIVIDGGNSHYVDAIARAARLARSGVHFVDVGTSGGVWGLERGFCLMIGGEAEVVSRLEPIFATLAPGPASVPRTPARGDGSLATSERGYLHCGSHGAGHFVKMVHNGIEYGMMAALAEGLNVLRHADAGLESRAVDAETTPLAHPEHFQYQFNLADIAEVWRRGSVVASWLLDLTADALAGDPVLGSFSDAVADSGEGRWTVTAAVEEGVPAHVLSAALYERFSSRGRGDFASRVLSAMRFQFGGHR